MLRERLDEISQVLGPYVPEAVVDRDPSEVALLHTLTTRIAGFKDRSYATSAGTSLRIVGIRKPLEDTESEEFEFVVPFIVQFDGKAAPEIWGEAERQFEAQVSDAVAEAAKQVFETPTVKLVRRKKSDPYKDDPRSLTLLRFRVS